MTEPALAPDARPLVRTRSGLVRGTWRGVPGSDAASAAFLGIPFAAPPVGVHRFGAPVAPEPWDGARDCSAHGPTAQRGDPGVTLIPEPSIAGDATLNVDVFTPSPGAGAALPVLVWIHGGGFVGGSPASPWYDGRAFNRDGIVTVTVSYRLGFDGFGHVDGAPENRAVLDWVAALEWVRDNIAEFGGDPGRVTIAGQSAGGAAVLTLLGMERARGLFSSAWAMSPPTAGMSMDAAAARSRALATLLGVAPTRDGFASASETEVLSAQRRLPAVRQNRLAQARATLTGGLPWGPVIDGELLRQHPVEAIAAGAGADIALVIGSTDDEFTMITDDWNRALRLIPTSFALSRLGLTEAAQREYLAANRAQRAKGPAAMIGRFVTDSVFRTTVARVAAARLDARGNAATWVYRFAWPSPTRRWALHCLDVPFWFDCLDDPGVAAIAGDAPPRDLSQDLHAAAVGLIRDGDPGWPRWSAAATTRVFDAASGSGVESDGYASVRALLGPSPS